MKTKLFAYGLLFTSVTAAFAQNIATRFGALTVNSDNVLLYNGKAVQPKVEGNNSLSFIKTFKLGGQDVVLVEDNGGTACPAMYHFVSVSKSGAKATKAFGTCTDLIKVARHGEAITVDMPGFTGPFATQSELNQFLKRRHVFRYAGGEVTEVVAGPKPAAFNPYIFYFPIGKQPSAFAHLRTFNLQPAKAGGRSNAEGFLYSDLSYNNGFKFTRIHFTPHHLTFTTGVERGEAFSFSGRFMQSGDLRRFSVGDSSHYTPILEGTVRRWLKGKQTGAVKMKFYCQAAVS